MGSPIGSSKRNHIDMIIVNVRIEFTPETIEALRETILTMQTATLEEEGCEDYSFSVELANPGAMRITERWASQAALSAHFQTPHMATFQAAMQSNPPLAVDAHFYDATEIDRPQ